jgi:hypothetical protein
MLAPGAETQACVILGLRSKLLSLFFFFGIEHDLAYR